MRSMYVYALYALYALYAIYVLYAMYALYALAQQTKNEVALRDQSDCCGLNVTLVIKARRCVAESYFM